LRGTDHNFSRHAIEITIVICSTIWLAFQLRKIFGTVRYKLFLSGSATLILGIGLIHSICIFFALGLRLGGQTLIEEMFVSIAIVLGWLHLLYYHAAVKLTGPFVVMVYQMIFSDIIRFASIFVLLILGFGPAFFLIFMDPRNPPSDFDTFSKSFSTVFLWSFGQIDYDQFQTLSGIQTTRGAFAHLFFYVFMVMAVILMLNLLIAMMGGTYANIIGHAELEWRWQLVTIVLLLEMNMTHTTINRMRPANQLLKDGQYYLIVSEVNQKWKVLDQLQESKMFTAPPIIFEKESKKDFMGTIKGSRGRSKTITSTDYNVFNTPNYTAPPNALTNTGNNVENLEWGSG